MPTEHSAGAVIFKKEKKEIKYLLLHYKYKSEYWGFPKGNIENDETEEQTAQREIREETNLEVDLIPDFKEKVSWFYKKEDQTIYKETVFFLAQAKSDGQVKISDEHLGYAWHTYQNAYKKLKFKNSQEILKKAHQFLTQ